MILEQRTDCFRVTFTSELGMTPRLEFFHADYKKAVELGSACHRLLQRDYPSDFPPSKSEEEAPVREGLLGVFGVTMMLSQLAAGWGILVG